MSNRLEPPHPARPRSSPSRCSSSGRCCGYLRRRDPLQRDITWFFAPPLRAALRRASPSFCPASCRRWVLRRDADGAARPAVSDRPAGGPAAHGAAAGSRRRCCWRTCSWPERCLFAGRPLPPALLLTAAALFLAGEGGRGRPAVRQGAHPDRRQPGPADHRGRRHRRVRRHDRAARGRRTARTPARTSICGQPVARPGQRPRLPGGVRAAEMAAAGSSRLPRPSRSPNGCSARRPSRPSRCGRSTPRSCGCRPAPTRWRC